MGLRAATKRDQRKVAVVTGANQGLGFALVEGLARRLAHGDVVYLTGRDRARVDDARRHISGARADVHARVVDVGDAASLATFASEIDASHGGLDIVISNHYQRVVPEEAPADVISRYVNINNLGTTRVLRAASPRLRRGGRLLVIASSLGALHELPERLWERFDTDTMDLDDIDAAVRRWRDAVVEGRAESEGWPQFINIPSKVAQVAAVRVLARERRSADRPDGAFLAAVCPGMIDTGASRPWFDMSGAQTPDQAAVAVLRLALDPDLDPALYGELVRFGKALPWNRSSS